ncbi:MAG: NAD(P)/FAD-dependent oxidoreductase [Paracoccaceae bacterium]
MSGIFPDHAYGPEPIKTCYWAETVPDWRFDCPPLQGDALADVAVIGGGFTGLSAALHLARAGVDTLLLESQFPGFGATGRNGGFCCLGGINLDDEGLARAVGEAGRREWRVVEKRAVELVADILRQENIDADTHSKGETKLAHSPKAMRGLEHHAAHIQADYGVAPVLHDTAELTALGMAGPFHGGLTLPIGFALNPRKYALGLMQAAQGQGARVHGYSPVVSVTQEQSLFRLKTPLGHVLARRVIFAMNGYAPDHLSPWIGGRFLPAQSSVLVTRPLTPQEQADAGWTSAQMAYDTRNLLHYFRLMPDGRMLFGRRGGVNSSPTADAKVMQDTRAHFDAMFPALSHVETPHGWHGFVALNRSGLPYVGPVPDMPDAFAGFGYHGNGVAMGSYAGALLADLARGAVPQHTYPAAMQQPPPRFPLGRHRRALLPLGYIQLGLADYFG